MFCGINSSTQSTNIIPRKVEITGSIRYLYDCANEESPMERMERIIRNICDAYRVKCEIKFEVSNYLLSNDEKMVNFVREEVLGKMEVNVDEITEYQVLGGEDFSEFSNKNGIPGAFIFVGIGNEEIGTDKPHHCSKFNIDEKMLPVGAELLKNIALKYFE